MRTILCLLAVALAGCAPSTQVVLRAGVRGTVVDARTGKPVTRAVVVVENATPTPDLTPQLATIWSGDDGTFSLRAMTRLRLFHEYRAAQGTVVTPLMVSRAGYATRRLELHTPLYTTEPGAVVDAGRVELQSLVHTDGR